LLSMIDYKDLTPPPLELPARGPDDGYVRPPLDEQTFVPQTY
jgi:polyphosphate kinase